ncbi:hypothetical protein BB347_14080 [Natronorubrum daqingense]|nr:hypothetical protein BB347_14080 [Natronorubrum daqingense]
MATRRTVLRTGALAGAGTIAGIVALPSPPATTPADRTVQGADPPTSVADWTDETISDEEATPIARYQYRSIDNGVDDFGDRDAFVATAPINVVLVPDEDAEGDGAPLERVMSVLDEEGWLRGPEEYTRYGWDRSDETFVRQEGTAAETYYGTSGRLHVRCWSFEGVVSMQAHEDTGARPEHEIESYSDARTAIEAIFDAAGWRVSPDAIDLDNEQGDHDGIASVITERTDGEETTLTEES